MNLIDAFRLGLDAASPDVVALSGAGGKTTTLFRLAAEIVARNRRVVTTTTTRIAAGQVAHSPAHLVVTGSHVPWAQLGRLLDLHGQCLLVTETEGEKRMGVAAAIVDELAGGAAKLDIAAVLVEADGSRGLPLKAPAAHEPVVPDAATILSPVMGLDALGFPVDGDHVHRPDRVRSLLGLADSDARISPQMAAHLLLHPQGGAAGKPHGAQLLPLLNKADTAPRLAGGRLIARMLAGRGWLSLIGAVGAMATEPIGERWGATTTVVLAAGESRRMGEAKQLLNLDGKPLVVHAVHTALDSGATEVVVVSGAHAPGVEEALAPLVSSAGGRLRLVHNGAWREGQATSVRAAVRALASNCQAALFLPVDQPNVPVSLLRLLWHDWRTGADLAAPSVDGELRGAPAVFDRMYWSQLCSLTGDQGGRQILKKPDALVATVAVPADWLEDVDTPEQWALIRQRGGRT